MTRLSHLSIPTLLLAFTGLSGCIEPVTQPLSEAAKSEVTPQVLSSIGSEVIIPTIDSFLFELDQLELTIIDAEEKFQLDQADTQILNAAKDNWIETAKVWQELELMQIGPAGDTLTTIGGLGIRDEIYSWPTSSIPCLIDQKTAEGDWESSQYFNDNLVNAYGLDALEHLLFSSLETSCPTQVAPVADGAWDALGAEGIIERRLSFAVFLLNGVRDQAEDLKLEWLPEGGDFGSLMMAEDVSSPYQNKDEALNAIFLSFFYLETMTKDQKLSEPLGFGDCSAQCSDEVESLESQASLVAIEANLIGFQNIFSGGDGVGFDDLLVDLGHADLAEEISTDTEAALKSIDHIEGPLSHAIQSNPDSVIELYEHIGLITKALKGDLSTVMNMEIPAEAAGDND
jgi:uncharacterized protein